MSAEPTLNNVHLEVKSCSKAVLVACPGHGKCSCFLQDAFVRLIGPDYPLLILPYADGAENLECAFCHGSK